MTLNDVIKREGTGTSRVGRRREGNGRKVRDDCLEKGNATGGSASLIYKSEFVCVCVCLCVRMFAMHGRICGPISLRLGREVPGPSGLRLSYMAMMSLPVL